MKMLMSLILTTVIGSAPAAEIYISPTGDDGNPGTEAKPLATLERARDAIRARAKGERGDGVTVWLQEGRYVRDRTFELDKRDSGTQDAPVVYRAVPGAKVIVDRYGRLFPARIRRKSKGQPVKSNANFTKET